MSKRTDITIDVVRDLYIQQRKTIHVICDILKCDESVVYNRFKKGGIKSRTTTEHQIGKPLSEAHKKAVSKGNKGKFVPSGKDNPRFKRREVSCDYCLKLVWKPAYHFITRKHSFCCRDCAHQYRVANKKQKRLQKYKDGKYEIYKIRKSPETYEWRQKVFERDNWTCRLCFNRSGQGNPVKLEPHHIQKFSDYPDLWFDVNNGITLCKACHLKTYFKEELYESYLTSDIKYRSIESTNC